MSTPKIFDDPELKLISWENEKLIVPFDLLQSAQFFNDIPDLTQDIKLEVLEIDTETLKNVIKFAEFRVEPFKVPKPITPDSKIFPDGCPLALFFENMQYEELLLLTLAAHKLDIKLLQKSCSYCIAKLFAAYSKDEVESELDINELTVDEEDYVRCSSFTWRKKRAA